MAFETTDIFKHCSPALRTDIERCGTVSLCTATKIETAAELDDIYKSDDDYRILGAMLVTAMEIKACGIVQNSWEDFFMANLRPMKKNIQVDSFTKGVMKIKPFILADQKHPINNVYWRATNGEAGAGGNWEVDVASRSGIPSDARSFTVGERVYIQSRHSGTGAMNLWAGVVAASELVGDVVHLTLTPQNAGTEFATPENPASGILRRGSANVGRSEAYCDDEPAYINNNAVEFWMEHTKTTLCSGSRWREWRRAIIENNPLYKKFFDLPEAESNKQKLQAFQSKVFNNAMFGQPISVNQTLSAYRSLPQVTSFLADNGLGVAGGTCDGYKANMIGWLQQIQRCGQVYDALGEDLNLWSLMDAIYILSRVRQGVGSAAATEFDLFTDSATAGLIDRGFIGLFKQYSLDTMRINVEGRAVTVEEGRNKAFGFYFRKYRLLDKTAGIVLNVITHRGLDDYLAEWMDYASQEADDTLIPGGRAIWLLDMTGMYLGVIESSRKSATSGRIEDLQKLDPAYLCVEDAATKEVIQVGLTATAVLECPAANLLIWNLGGGIPDYTESSDRPNYLPSNTNNYY